MAGDATHTPGIDEAAIDGDDRVLDLGLDVERVRGERRRFIPGGVYRLAIITVLALVVAGGFLIIRKANEPQVTPAVVGMTMNEAVTYLRQQGFEPGAILYRAGGQSGAVVAQTPSAGAPIAAQGTVDLVVAAGSGKTPVPPVVGLGFDLAAGRLEMAGIPFDVDYELSNESSGTVLAVEPPEGTELGSGERVRLVLALDTISARQILPFDLSALTVAIQPTELPATQRDITLAVANRLGGLLEVSDAKVVYARDTLTSAEDLSPERLQARVDAASPDLLIVIDADGSPDGGVRVDYGAASIEDTSTAAVESGELAQRIAERTARGFGDHDISVVPERGESVTYSGGGTRPWVVIGVGSYRVNSDLHAWSQEDFVGSIARSIYLGIARGTGAELKR